MTTLQADGGRALVRYRSFVADSARWEGFPLRAGDIIISTPAKCGTTWTQMITALLVFQTPDLPAPLSVLSPWLDMVTRARRDVVADLEAQTHRRFVKTHTPLPGLPLAAGVTYICVGRDPRDVALSMDDHMSNMDMAAFEASRVAAAAADGLAAPEPLPPRPPGEPDLRARFWRWVLDDTPSTEVGSSLLRTVDHVRSFWDARGEADVVMLHYHDLKIDLEGQMRALADRLGVAVPEDRWPALVEAASFAAMRERAPLTAPNTDTALWRDPAGFFKEGRSGAWRDLLRDPGDQRRYEERVAALAPPELSAWLHRS